MLESFDRWKYMKIWMYVLLNLCMFLESIFSVEKLGMLGSFDRCKYMNVCIIKFIYVCRCKIFSMLRIWECYEC